jgi:hypothetical protein
MVTVPKQAEFEDYAALAYRDEQLAIVSQASARLWMARIDEKARALVPGSGTNIASRARVKAMSRESPGCPVTPGCRLRSEEGAAAPPLPLRREDQSIHLFRIPAG